MNASRDGARGQPRVEAQFDHADRHYEPGERLTVQYEVEGIDPETVRALECSILWYTEGKGEEDLGVHHFQRMTDAVAVRGLVAAGSFGAALPASPLSYEGVIVKVRWCARVRLFFDAGRDFVSEHEFVLGAVPPARRLPAPEE